MMFVCRLLGWRCFTVGLCALCLFGIVSARATPNRDSGASAFVSAFGNQLVGVINSDKAIAEKKEDILPLIRQNVDIEGIGKFCLGRYWHVATPDQQKRYLDLFHRVLVNAVTGKLGEYQGVSFEVIGEKSSPSGDIVAARVRRPDQPEAAINVVLSHQGGYKVTDLIGEGTSLRLTQRQDYASYLARHSGNVDALIVALRKQIDAHR